jgi:hypothetical protein
VWVTFVTGEAYLTQSVTVGFIKISPASAEKFKTTDESSGLSCEIRCGARVFKGEKGIII